jgi:hypothetical protein
VTAAAYFVMVELHRRAVAPNFDVYVYFIPNKLHAAWSVRHGGKGLLWNPYQACGEPFFANPAMGLLYPPHLLFLALDANVAVHAVLVLNMVIGATGTYLLAAELGLGRMAALLAALAFELGDATAQLTGWSPMHSGPWSWLPWALLLCERVLRAPTGRRVAGLAAVLALGILPGWVLVSALTFQLIALRVAWELLTRPGRRPWRPAAAVAGGLVAGVLLAAVQLLPAAELARDSQRVGLDFSGFWAYGGLETDVVSSIARRVPPVPFMATVLVLAALAPLATRHRRIAAFFLVAGGLYAVLALGPATPLFRLYVALPPGGATLRYPHRLFWITGFALVMLAALALDGAIDQGRRRAAAPLAAALAAVLQLAVPGGLRPVEIVSLVAVVAALLAAAARPRLGVAAGWVVVGAVAANLVGVPLRYGGKLLPSAAGLSRHADAFAAIRSRLTPQDRVLLVSSLPSLLDLSLAQKTATIMRVPDVYDYEPLIGRRLGDYYSAMWHGTPVTDVEELTRRPTVVAGYRPRLFALASVRYVVTPPSSPFTTRGLDLRPVPDLGPALAVWANDGALPRARWVPRIEVIPDPDALLTRLAFGSDDLADLAFVEEPTPSGFTGGPGAPGPGRARFALDDPEHLVIEVEAPARGFVVLADQWAPGWRAAVNGAPAAILRANYAFRLIEVPAGASRVELRYRPASLAAGAAISAIAVAGLALVAARGGAGGRGGRRGA